MNNLPQKYNFISHIKSFFYNLFNRKTKKIENDIEIKENISTNEKNTFANQLKDDINKIETRKYIMEKLENNPEILDSLSLERLQQIENMYDDTIKENSIELQELDFKIDSYKKFQ